jgi:hypothetical protein
LPIYSTDPALQPKLGGQKSDWPKIQLSELLNHWELNKPFPRAISRFLKSISTKKYPLGYILGVF